MVPSGAKARARANIEALRLLQDLHRTGRTPGPREHEVLAGWSSWGAIPLVLDERDTTFTAEREQLHGLLDEAGWDAARRTTLNAHYTDPAYAQAVWDTVVGLGFTGGRVLEPGCGSGTFLGLAPADLPGRVELVGVELDPATAAIAGALYPHAQVVAESFADTRLPAGSVDLVVGNVPFSDVVLYDPVHNRDRHSLHNHFIVKSLDLTRPGGLVAVLSSRYTMDAANPGARRAIAERADLIGAVRLPNGSHQRTAGTDVVTDLLILRRREPDAVTDAGPDAEAAGEPGWVRTRTVELPGGPATINTYFLDHPERVLGDLRVGTGAYSAHNLLVDPPVQPGRAVQEVVAERLRQVCAQVVADARELDLGWLPPAAADAAGRKAPVRAVAGPVAAVGAEAARFEGFLSAHPDGAFTARHGGAEEPLDVPATQARELRDLLGLRDAVVALLEAEAATGEDTEAIGALRRRLNAGYDAYTASWGPLNRFTSRRTGRVDPDTGAEKLARIRPPVFARFGRDPFAATVLALEEFDAATQSVTKAAVLRQRVVAPRPRRLGADTPADALAICLDSHGEVRLDTIAGLLGVTEPDARTALGTLVFDDPGTPPDPADPGRADPGTGDAGGAGTGRPRLVPAAEYLSGNVRAKLAAAERALAMDTAGDTSGGAAGAASRYEVNLTALRAVIPADLGPGEIDARLGAAWIGPADVQAFLRELLEDPRLEVDRIVGSDWTVRSGPGARYGVAATEAWGTERYPAQRVAEALLRQAQIRVTDELEDGTRVLNPTETTAAVEKAREMSDRFAEWVWEDPARAGRLARVYNETFNAIRLRSYDAAGADLSLPGLAVTFTPRPHQRAAVARMIAEPAVGLFHEVGAGKTAEMVIGAMELRRLGMVAKPAIVVPNHMLEQFAREALQLYPQARVLAAGAEDLTRDRRRAFLARVSTGDPDLVVLTRTAFAALPLSAEEQRRYIEDELTPLREALAARSGDNSLAVKRIERLLLAREESMKARIGAVARDGGLTFELTGIDYLLVDELHDYKNLATASNIPDANITGSHRASDLHMKIAYLRRVNGERVVTGATATPIANSVTEAYVMQRYLRPDLLADAGIADFDTWAATFGATVTELEMSPDGGHWRPKTRFAKFRNVPELLTQWHVSADVKTAADLGLPTPDLRVRPDGRRAAQTVVIPAPDEVRAYVAALGERAERIRARMVDPSEDNMLKLTSDGRKAALDMRLVDPTLPGAEHGKISVAAARIAAIYAEHRDRAYLGAAGEEHPRAGAFQLVFCDLGTPGDPSAAGRGRWNVYDALRAELVARGVPGEGIRYIHEADTDAKKAALFAQCRTGGVAVLIGSTAKMGVGTNVQARAVALHHLDCPWRPADLAQRDGRILRQGNQNPEVGIYRYVVEGSFDAYSWQTVERKAKFIGQVMTGRLDTREIDDVGDSAALSFNEVKALASGNPLLLEAAEADAEAGRLERLARAHQRGQRMLAQTITDSTAELAAVTDVLAATETAIARRVDTRGDAFAITLHGRRYVERPAAAADLPALLATAAAGPDDRPITLGELGGQDLQARPDRHRTGRGAVRVYVGVRGNDVVINADDLAAAARSNSAALGLLARLERAVSALDGHHRALATRQERLTAEIRTAQGRLGAAFPHTEALAAAKARQATIAAALAAQTADRDPAPAPTVPAPAAGPGRAAEQRAQLHAALAQIQAAQAAERDAPGYTWDGLDAPGIDRDPGIGI